MENEFQIYTDGGFLEQTGRGAWAYWILKDGDTWMRNGGAGRSASPLYSELEAVVRSIGELPAGSHALVHTDSIEVAELGVRIFNDTAMTNWLLRLDRFKFFGDLISTLRALLRSRSADWYLVRGHSGDVHNEWCDARCRLEMGKSPRPAKYSIPSEPVRILADQPAWGLFGQRVPGRDYTYSQAELDKLLASIEERKKGPRARLARQNNLCFRSSASAQGSGQSIACSIRKMFDERYPLTPKERFSAEIIRARNVTVQKAILLASRSRKRGPA